MSRPTVGNEAFNWTCEATADRYISPTGDDFSVDRQRRASETFEMPRSWCSSHPYCWMTPKNYFSYSSPASLTSALRRVRDLDDMSRPTFNMEAQYSANSVLLRRLPWTHQESIKRDAYPVWLLETLPLPIFTVIKHYQQDTGFGWHTLGTENGGTFRVNWGNVVATLQY